MSARLASLDAYRGAIMLLLVAGPLLGGVLSGLGEGAGLAQRLSEQFRHVPWTGCALWDLIEPAFLVMIGVALPYSSAARARDGESIGRTRLHVARRSLVFLLLGLMLSSNGYSQTRFNFTGLLSQVALAYPFAFLTVGRGRARQVGWIVVLVVGWWLAFVLHPTAPAGFDLAEVGLPRGVEPLTGFFAHWNRGFNFSASFDLWFLNLFPTAEVFRFDPLGNQTLNFLPRIATMTIGVMAGEQLRSNEPRGMQCTRLLVSGLGLLAVGLVLGMTICPLVKNLWTSSWVLFSAGFALLGLGVSYWLIEIVHLAPSAYPLIVVGQNPLAIYLLNALAYPWLARLAGIHLTSSWALQQVFAIGALWSVCFWMARRRIFLRL